MVVDLFEAPIRNQAHFIRASVEELPLDPGMFGAVVCVGEVLGYCDPARAIPEFARVLSSPGLLICDFGSTRSCRHWFRATHSRSADLITDQYQNTPEPIWIYHPHYIESLLAVSGFKKLSVYGTHTWSAISRRIGISAPKATRLQRLIDWLPFPNRWADVTTIVAALGEPAKAQR